MRLTIIANILVVFSIVSALAGILFLNLSWIISSIVILSFLVYAYLYFMIEMNSSKVILEREILDKAIFLDEPVRIRTKITNKGKVAIRGVFEDQVLNGCKISSGITRTSEKLPPNSQIILSYSIIPDKRNIQIIQELRIEREDIFGLFIQEQILEHETPISIHTQKESIEIAKKIAKKEHLEYSGIARNIAQVLQELEFDTIREYFPGDKARDISWKQFSKLNKLLTKSYKKEGALQSTILIDSGRSMRIADKGVSKIDHSVDLAIQLSKVLLSGFSSVGIVIFDENKIIEKINPGIGKTQFDTIVRIIKETPSSIEIINKSEEKKESQHILLDFPFYEKVNGNAKERSNFPEILKDFDQEVIEQRTFRMSLESLFRTMVSDKKKGKQLFILITDLVSSRDIIIYCGKLCRLTGNKMIIIDMYNDWYRKISEPLDIPLIENGYKRILYDLKLEERLKRLGAHYLRIGPADSTMRIVRILRRGKA